MSNDLPARVKEVLTAQNKRTVYIVLSPTGEGNKLKFNSDDFDEETLRITNAMAVGTVTEGHNQYLIAPERTKVNLTTENGIPLPISNEAPGGDGNAYTQRATIGSAKAIFENSSDSQTLGIQVIKGKAIASNSQTKDYNILLAQVNNEGQESVSELVASLEQVLINQNSNSPANKFIERNGIPEKDSSVGRVVIQTKLGEYSKIAPTVANGGSQTGNVSAEGNFLANQDMMQSLGSQVPLKGAGEYYIPKNAFNPGEIALARLSTLAPGTARLGGRIEFNSVLPANILQETNNDFSNVSSPELDQAGKTSYGSYNTWLNAFDNVNTVTIVPGLAIQLGALSLVLTGLAALLKTSDRDLVEFQIGFVTFFGLPPLRNPGNAVDFTISVASLVTTGRIYRETGWYATIIRSINRLLVESTVGVGLNISKNAGDTISNIDIVANAATNVLAQFQSGRLIGFIKQLIYIGRATLNYQGRNPINYSAGFSNFAPSVIDNIEDSSVGVLPDSSADELQSRKNINLSALVKKSRLKRPYGFSTSLQTSLAWGTSTTPSTYILPNNMLVGANRINSTGDAALASLRNVGAVSTDTGRIPKQIVDSLEEKLDSSYMPFYFHDLRTNEIVSFHAFLESTKDGFNIEWNSQTSYGRVEPIHTYKGTTRDINVSFYVVATNKEDHSNMWWKINKLVTMIYPQYTEGRKITTASGLKFIQPFSQIPGSSPIIRLRLGDVWKTNYSRFNVARLFGLTESANSFNVSQQAVDYQERRATLIQERTENISREIRRGHLFEGYQFSLEFPEIVAIREDLTSAGDIVTVGSDLNVGGSNLEIDGQRYLQNDFFGIDPQQNLGLNIATRQAVAQAGVDMGTKLLMPRPFSAGRYILKVDEVILGSVTMLDEIQAILEYRVSFVDPPANITNNSFKLRVPNSNVLVETWAELSRQYNERNVRGPAQALQGAITATTDALYTVVTSDIEMALNFVLATSRLQRDRPWNSLQPDNDWLNNYISTIVDEELNSEGVTPTQEQVRQSIVDFFGETNPIMQAFETTSGKGLAVAFKNLDIDWSNSTWETDWDTSEDSNRAPKMLKITMGGTVIHDITPGIDSSGFNVAPVYQVGNSSTVLSKIHPTDAKERRASNERIRQHMDIPRIGGGR